MSVKEEIDKAIGAHGLWKQKLRTAIETGDSDADPEMVKQDCNCAFGKWLHERIPTENRESPFYQEIVDIHAAFHCEAGSILEMALSGRVEQASERMKLGSAFLKISSDLTKKMKEWQASL